MASMILASNYTNTGNEGILFPKQQSMGIVHEESGGHLRTSRESFVQEVGIARENAEPRAEKQGVKKVLVQNMISLLEKPGVEVVRRESGNRL
jgi:hypothetical protein